MLDLQRADAGLEGTRSKSVFIAQWSKSELFSFSFQNAKFSQDLKCQGGIKPVAFKSFC